MPRILSRNTAMYKRRNSSILKRAGSSATASSNGSLLPRNAEPIMPWAAGEDSFTPTTSTTASSSPSITSRRSTSMDSRRMVMVTTSMMLPNPIDTWESDDAWGQFVDPAEAEQQLIRSSKILSKRYSLR